MKRYSILIAIGLAFASIAWFASDAWSKSNEELTRENEELRKRVDELEKKLDKVFTVLEERGKAEPKKVGDGECARGTDVKKDTKRPLELVTGSLPLSVYGHLRLDGSFDDSRTNYGNTAMWVLPEQVDDDEEFNLTARHTRLGLVLNAPKTEGIKADGRVEVDFYGKEDEISNNLRLRHAYFTLGFEDNWRVLAGQTDDVHAPLSAKTLNTCVGWGVGNLGYRRPQIRVEKWFGIDERKLTLQLAAARPYSADHDKDGADDGEDAGTPDMQARVACKFPGLTAKPAEVGFGGHWGRREVAFAGFEDDYHSWSLALDVSLPLFEKLALQCELWTGEFLDGYRGGIRQGFNFTDGEPIESKGGFAQLMYTPSKRWKVFTGVGIDDPEDSTLTGGAKPMRSRNQMVFFNLRRSLTKNVWLGLEYQRLVTRYKDSADADDNRFQTTFCYGF